MTYGIDVSNVNGHIDWGRVAGDGITFAFAKATEGLTFDDRLFAENRAGARAHGVHFGAYHFARPDTHPNLDGARAEAAHFARLVGSVSFGELRPALDLEVGSGGLTAWAGAFLSELEKRLKVRPVLYSYSAFIRSHLSLGSLSGYPLWLADYGRNDGVEHPVSTQCAVHQFTSTAVVHGVASHVDKNSAAALSPILAFPPKPQPKPIAKTWPIPVPAWFWTWARWRFDGQTYERPWDAPYLIPPWAWVRLRALQRGV